MEVKRSATPPQDSVGGVCMGAWRRCLPPYSAGRRGPRGWVGECREAGMLTMLGATGDRVKQELKHRIQNHPPTGPAPTSGERHGRF